MGGDHSEQVITDSSKAAKQQRSDQPRAKASEESSRLGALRRNDDMPGV